MRRPEQPRRSLPELTWTRVWTLQQPLARRELRERPEYQMQVD